MPDRLPLPSSPVKVPNNPAIEKGDGQSKDKNKDKDDGKDLNQAYTKDLNKPKKSAHKESDLVKEHE